MPDVINEIETLKDGDIMFLQFLNGVLLSMNELETFLSAIAANDATTTVYQFTTASKYVPTRCRARLFPNSKGETAIIEICECHTDGGAGSLPFLWYKHGYTPAVVKNYLTVECYVYDAGGNCFADYNPTVKLSDDGRRMVIDFEWLLPVCEQNKQAIMREIARRFYKTTE